MTAKPALETIRSPGWIAALLAVLAALTFMYIPLFTSSYAKWLQPDYSHGFLVPLFAAFLAWHWRSGAPKQIAWPEVWGLAFLAGGVALYLTATFTNFAREWLWGASLVINLCGLALLLGGWPMLRWLWPVLAFLVFMFPLPYRVEYALSGPLQRVAAIGSGFVLQTIGYATYREGVILHVRDHTLEVANACNGLSMLLTFVTLSVAMALVVNRPWLDRGLILASAVPIAIVSNIVRIAATGVLYNEGGKELGDKLFHDLAGWVMMPMALIILWLELKLLDWVLLEDLGRASREDVIKNVAGKPAYLFMAAFEGDSGPKPAAPADPAAGGTVPPQGSAR
ncbi:MAG TPA: exosortase/archaeosortase family protein [Gemmataceae bacterium]|nr:exosortase/archaeosortase family protein [Gemmataceae bacterium]